MDTERTIDDIEQLQEMFEAPDIRLLSASDISAANRRHDEMLAHSPWFWLWQNYVRQIMSDQKRDDYRGVVRWFFLPARFLVDFAAFQSIG